MRFEERGGDQSQERVVVEEDRDDVGALDPAVEPSSGLVDHVIVDLQCAVLGCAERRERRVTPPPWSCRHGPHEPARG
ncbi:hypothetical protein GCM10014715_64210 [Streptomyces spiralis]|uniref:Uncharacterized protein n=1 Tax=Streptomyces spiralis TaxID=66376 RepID=A0A919E0V0_9ACTN|nr:hypothetical protein GCM10014715_64210 [Streptomyces spiralis]